MEASNRPSTVTPDQYFLNNYFTSILCIRFVRKAVQPAFPRLRRSDNGMTAGPGVLARVPVGRRVATECDSAGLACAEMNPMGVDLDALFALMLFGMFNGRDGLDMRTGLCAH
jgi:hypothetical protein